MPCSRLVPAALLALLIFAGCGAADKPVAVVNGEAITRRELRSSLEAKYGRLVVQMLAEKRAILQEAKKRNITCSDEELRARTAELLDPSKSPPETVMRIKSDPAKMQELSEGIRMDIIVRKLILSDVSESEKKAFYERNKADLLKTKAPGAQAKSSYEELKGAVEEYLVRTKMEAFRRAVMAKTKVECNL